MKCAEILHDDGLFLSYGCEMCSIAEIWRMKLVRKVVRKICGMMKQLERCIDENTVNPPEMRISIVWILCNTDLTYIFL